MKKKAESQLEQVESPFQTPARRNRVHSLSLWFSPDLLAQAGAIPEGTPPLFHFSQSSFTNTTVIRRCISELPPTRSCVEDSSR